ncbi:MAG: FAD-binding oxidoreductase [Alphaproteobacteria bacterium]|nr:FAD-binding oxidoreductase [Alphaproteobacteria bacterium]
MVAREAQSYYLASANPAPVRAPLEGEAVADVCVVGAGFTGLSAALHLAEHGHDVAVVEANRVGWGASGRNGGQTIVGLASGMVEARELLGEAWARRIWELTLEAVALQRQLIERFEIACDYRPGYVYAAARPRHMAEIVEEHELLARWGYDGARVLDRTEIARAVVGPNYAGGLLDRESGHLHPLNYALGLAAAATAMGVRIYEGTRAIEVARGQPAGVRTERGRVRCRHVLLAGNAYLDDLAPTLADHVLPVTTYILATEPLGERRARELIPDDVCVSDSKRILDYYRLSADHRLLFGGRADYSLRAPGNLAEAMRRRMLAAFPQLDDVRLDYLWGGNVAVSSNRLPHVGRLDDGVYFAQGFSGHGVALTGMVGKLVAEAIVGESEGFDLLARIPHKRFPGGRAVSGRLKALGVLWYRLRDRLEGSQ